MFTLEDLKRRQNAIQQVIPVELVSSKIIKYDDLIIRRRQQRWKNKVWQEKIIEIGHLMSSMIKENKIDYRWKTLRTEDCFSSTEIEIDSSQIDRRYNEWLETYHELTKETTK